MQDRTPKIADPGTSKDGRSWTTAHRRKQMRLLQELRETLSTEGARAVIPDRSASYSSGPGEYTPTPVGPYTGDYASVLLRVVRRYRKGVAVDVLMGAVGVVSSHDQTFPDFVEAMDYLHDCGLIGSEEYDALPDDEKRLELQQIWKLLP